MNNFLKSIFLSGCAALAIVVLSSAIITANFFVKIDNGKGYTKIIHSSDRIVRASDLPAGTYTFTVCDEQGNDIAVTAEFEYSVLNQRQAADEMSDANIESKQIEIKEHYSKDDSHNMISIPENGSTIRSSAVILPKVIE